MIKKTIIVVVILFTGYSIFLGYFAPTWWYATQYQQQANVIKGQKYLYAGNEKYTNVVVGSSLSTRLFFDSLPQTYDLSLEGLGALEGLDLITHKSLLPKNVFIEQNLVLRTED